MFRNNTLAPVSSVGERCSDAERCRHSPFASSRRADVVMRRRRAAPPTARVQHATLEDLTGRRISPDTRLPFRPRNFPVYGHPNTSQGESASFDRNTGRRPSRRSSSYPSDGRNQFTTQSPLRRVHFLTLSSHYVYVQLIAIAPVFLLRCHRITHGRFFCNVLRCPIKCMER